MSGQGADAVQAVALRGSPSLSSGRPLRPDPSGYRSFPRQRESIFMRKNWVPAFAGASGTGANAIAINRAASLTRSKQQTSFSRRGLFASEFCKRVLRTASPKEGGGAPQGASNHVRAAHRSVAVPTCIADKSTQSAQTHLQCGSAPRTSSLPRTVRLRARSPSGAPPRLLSSDRMLGLKAQAALHAIERERGLPAPSIALKPSTWLAGL
jgi:hypothetical protein